MRSPFNAVSLMCLCVWHAAASAQSVDGEWRGRLECSDFLAGVQGPANSAGPFGYGITVNLSSGVVDGSRGTNTVEEKFTGSSDGRRMRFLVDGKRKDRPAWWTINLAGPVRDGTAKLEGQMLNRPGTPIRNCALTLVSSEYRTTLEAEFAAKQRAIARERREAELIEENSKLRAAPAESERMVREAVAAAEATRRAEQKSVEDRSAGDTGSSIGPPAPPKRVVRQQPQTTPRPVPQDGKAVLDPPRRADAKTPAMDASPPIENAAAVDRSATAKAAADKAAAEKSASDKAATDKAAAEKASADKASVERAAVLEKATAEKMAAERVAAEKAAAERAAAEKGKKQPIRVRNSMDL